MSPSNAMSPEKYKCLSFKVIQPDNFLISNKIKLIENCIVFSHILITTAFLFLVKPYTSCAILLPGFLRC